MPLNSRHYVLDWIDILARHMGDAGGGGGRGRPLIVFRVNLSRLTIEHACLKGKEWGSLLRVVCSRRAGTWTTRPKRTRGGGGTVTAQ